MCESWARIQFCMYTGSKLDPHTSAGSNLDRHCAWRYQNNRRCWTRTIRGCHAEFKSGLDLIKVSFYVYNFEEVFSNQIFSKITAEILSDLVALPNIVRCLISYVVAWSCYGSMLFLCLFFPLITLFTHDWIDIRMNACVCFVYGTKSTRELSTISTGAVAAHNKWQRITFPKLVRD